MNSLPIHPAPPSQAGLTWRLISQSDLAAVVDLARSGFAMDGGLVFLFEPDYVQERYFPDAPGAGIGGWTPAGQLGACATVHRLDTPEKLVVRFVGMVRPELRQRGLGETLLHWSEAQAQILLAGGAGTTSVFQIATESLSAPADRLYRRHGYERTFDELVMERDLRQPLPDLSMPPGITIVPWHMDRSNEFFQAYEASFRERPGFPGYAPEEWIDRVVSTDLMPEWTLLASAQGMPVGFVVGDFELSLDPPGGYIWQIGVIPEYRRRGLASALLVETMRRMKQAGATKALLIVNTNNPGAIAAYERLGYHTVGRRARYEKSHRL